MGYDIDRFTSQVDDGLLCSVCRDVIQDGLQAPCEHAYCSTCIRAWLVNEVTCPDDRQPVHVNELRPLFRYMRNMLNGLQIRCRNHQAGCDQVCSLELVEQHEAGCSYVTEECPNPGCRVTLESRALAEHSRVCQMRTRQCPNGCGLVVLTTDDTTHNCVVELRMTVDLLRSEMTSQLYEQQREADRMLNEQRRHVTQRSATLQADLHQLRSMVLALTSNFQDLLEVELRWEEQLKADNAEKNRLIAAIKALQTANSENSENTPSI